MQEILTVKSDDVVGRVKTYEAIVKGENVPRAGLPESFKVLIKELQSLLLDIKVLDDEDNEIPIRESQDDDYDEETVRLIGDMQPPVVEPAGEVDASELLFAELGLNDDEDTEDDDFDSEDMFEGSFDMDDEE